MSTENPFQPIHDTVAQTKEIRLLAEDLTAAGALLCRLGPADEEALRMALTLNKRAGQLLDQNMIELTAAKAYLAELGAHKI